MAPGTLGNSLKRWRSRTRGPLAGYFAKQLSTPLTIVPIYPQNDDSAGLSFAFDIAMGVRREDAILREKLNAVITRRQAEIRQLLQRYGIPILDSFDRAEDEGAKRSKLGIEIHNSRHFYHGD